MSSPSETICYSDPLDVSSVFGLLVKHGGERLRQWELEYGVRLHLTHPSGIKIKPVRSTADHQGNPGTTARHVPVLLCMSGTRTALQVAVPMFKSIVLDDPAGYRATCHSRWDEKVRVESKLPGTPSTFTI